MSAKPLVFKRSTLALAIKAPLWSLVLCGVVGAISFSKAQSAGGSVLYRLNTGSTFQRGCFAPCECPVMIGVPLSGTLFLKPSGSDGSFSNYIVMEVHWTFTNNNAASVVTGSGTYRVGGSNGIPQQQLTLFLQEDAGKVEHFDSGLVTNSVAFPDIKVSISTNHQFCFDTVFNVNASPTPVPQVSIGLADTNAVVLSWAVSTNAFVLQECSDLTAANWTAVTNPPTIVEQQNQVVLPRSAGNKWYCLKPGG